MKWWVGCCGLLLVLGRAFAAEGQANFDWLKTVAFAGHQIEYSGTFVYQAGSYLETSKITHLVETDSEYEKIESLDNPKREIVRHHGQTWCCLDHKMVQVDNQQARGGFPSQLFDDLPVLAGNYSIKDLGLSSVAGYKAQVLIFQPKDNLRYAHKLWVSADTGLLLKSAVLSEKSQIVEQYAFTEIKIGHGVDRSWLASSKPATKSALTPAKAAVNSVANFNSGWVADALPVGYKKMAELLRPMHGKHAPVTQLVYSDGLSAISIFIEASDSDEDDIEGLTSRGAVNLYHKVVDKHLYTVVGEVPPRTVMQVLDSIRYNGK
jgi:sigma-E factor negative regulatory protein RseB